MKTDFFCFTKWLQKKLTLRCSAININYNNRSRQLDAITVFPSASRERVSHFCLRFVSHDRHARKTRLQSRDKAVFQMQIGGALFIWKVYCREQLRSILSPIITRRWTQGFDLPLMIFCNLWISQCTGILMDYSKISFPRTILAVKSVQKLASLIMKT